MIKTFTAYTEEIDDREDAYDEVIRGLDMDGKLLHNTVGIISCYTDFIQEGTAQYIADKLPFNCIGCSTISIATTGHMGQLGLGIMVLTSDDCNFTTNVSKPFSTIEEMRTSIGDLMHKFMIASTFYKPQMLFPLMPFMKDISAENILEQVTANVPDIPIFGAVGSAGTVSLDDTCVFYNDQVFNDAVAMLGFFNNFKPSFYTISFDELNYIGRQAMVTASDGVMLKEVNDKPVFEYFAEIGAYDGETLLGGAGGATETTAAIFDLDNGNRLIRAIAPGQTENTDGILLTGDAPVGAKFTLASMSYDDILTSTKDVLARMIKDADKTKLNALAYSCVTRNW
ncbi:MAG: hypothetical protein LBM21_02795, partial [Coriobacteriales bacterium]|nr:hypothetical protein [Coriobacteriales bacterium]